MNNVKKIYQPLISLLQENSSKKISSILPQILELVNSKQAQKSFKLNEDGEVTHIFCYYHKLWEPVSECEYGSKVNTATGLNSMCKEGLSSWTKQQREFRKSKEAILNKVIEGTISPQEIEAEIQRLEDARMEIHARADGIGSDSI